MPAGRTNALHVTVNQLRGIVAIFINIHCGIPSIEASEIFEVSIFVIIGRQIIHQSHGDFISGFIHIMLGFEVGFCPAQASHADNLVFIAIGISNRLGALQSVHSENADRVIVVTIRVNGVNVVVARGHGSGQKTKDRMVVLLIRGQGNLFNLISVELGFGHASADLIVSANSLEGECLSQNNRGVACIVRTAAKAMKTIDFLC